MAIGKIEARLSFEDGRSLVAEVTNLTHGGCVVLTDSKLAFGEKITLNISGEIVEAEVIYVLTSRGAVLGIRAAAASRAKLAVLGQELPVHESATEAAETSVHESFGSSLDTSEGSLAFHEEATPFEHVSDPDLPSLPLSRAPSAASAADDLDLGPSLDGSQTDGGSQAPLDPLSIVRSELAREESSASAPAPTAEQPAPPAAAVPDPVFAVPPAPTPKPKPKPATLPDFAPPVAAAAAPVPVAAPVAAAAPAPVAAPAPAAPTAPAVQAKAPAPAVVPAPVAPAPPDTSEPMVFGSVIAMPVQPAPVEPAASAPAIPKRPKLPPARAPSGVNLPELDFSMESNSDFGMNQDDALLLAAKDLAAMSAPPSIDLDELPPLDDSVGAVDPFELALEEAVEAAPVVPDPAPASATALPREPSVAPSYAVLAIPPLPPPPPTGSLAPADPLQTKEPEPAPEPAAEPELPAATPPADLPPLNLPSLGNDGVTVSFHSPTDFKSMFERNLRHGGLVVASGPLPLGTQRMLSLVVPGHSPYAVSARVMFHEGEQLGFMLDSFALHKVRLQTMAAS